MHKTKIDTNGLYLFQIGVRSIKLLPQGLRGILLHCKYKNKEFAIL